MRVTKKSEEVSSTVSIDAEMLKQMQSKIEYLEALTRKTADIDRLAKFDKAQAGDQKRTCRIAFYKNNIILDVRATGWRPHPTNGRIKENLYSIKTMDENGDIKTEQVYFEEFHQWLTRERLGESIELATIEEQNGDSLRLTWKGIELDVSSNSINM